MIKVRPATASDLESLHAIVIECFGPANTPLAQLRWLVEHQGEKPLLFLSGAEIDGVVAGFLSHKLHEIDGTRHVEILEVGVGKNFRREGVAEALIRDVMEWTKTRGGVGLTLRARESDQPTLELSEKLGFLVDRIIPKYYADGEGAVLLRTRIA